MAKQSGWPTTSRHERGYGKEWDRLRLQVLKRDCGLCQPCRKAGKVTPAREVDHIKPKSKGGTDAQDNLQAICQECHKAKTAEEQGRTLLPKRVVGSDGWPVDAP